MTDLVIGGAGIFGLTVAERAARHGFRVRVVEERDHIGGNCWSHVDDETGVEIHTYGSHIFHTNNERVWEYVNRFSDWVTYEHRVRTIAQGKVIPLPFGLGTFTTVLGRMFTPATLRSYIESLPQIEGDNLEAVAISSVGVDVYEAVIKGYTKKHWGRDPRDLPASTIKRLPVRYTWDDRYFTDKYQALPADGYRVWLERMADSPNIDICLNSNVLAPEHRIAPMLFTGPVDAYFDYQHGRLGWRTVDFKEHRPTVDDFQGCPVVNYGNADVPWTRIHEYKHYRPDREYRGTIVHSEYAREAEPGEIGAYPVNTETDRGTLKKYREEADKLDGVWFGGRLGTYKYIDMHMAIASALTMWDTRIFPYLEPQ